MMLGAAVRKVLGQRTDLL